MPDQDTIARARQDAAEGKSPSTQAGEFVREEIHHVREGVHGARSTKQAIAIGLSKARRAGVELPPPPENTSSSATRRKATQDSAKAKFAAPPVDKTIPGHANGPGARKQFHHIAQSHGRSGAFGSKQARSDRSASVFHEGSSNQEIRRKIVDNF